jgi:caa(3)-type oxidase subunit IV
MEANTAVNVAHGDYSPAVYVRIWAILLVLLGVSIIGPTFGIRTLTIITAFGIAIVKALMVASYFMHLKVEQKIIWYLLISMLLAMVLFFSGTIPDVMTEGGVRWTNRAAQEIIQKHQGRQPQSGPHQGGRH